MRLKTLPVTEKGAIRAFFDRLAPDYRDQHGPADRLLQARVALIRRLLPAGMNGHLLEIGCGTGLHLFALADDFALATGIDFAPAMIQAAERVRVGHRRASTLRLLLDDAVHLDTIPDGSTDIVLCVGVLEHIPDQLGVLRAVRRVLCPGGYFICLTPNADWVWYSCLAPVLRFDTRHLSSDHFLSRGELIAMLTTAGLRVDRIGHWSFIPRGDMPRPIGSLFSGLDLIGRWLNLSRLRGGLYCRACRD